VRPLGLFAGEAAGFGRDTERAATTGGPAGLPASREPLLGRSTFQVPGFGTLDGPLASPASPVP